MKGSWRISGNKWPIASNSIQLHPTAASERLQFLHFDPAAGQKCSQNHTTPSSLSCLLDLPIPLWLPKVHAIQTFADFDALRYALSQAACHLHRFRHQQAAANFQRSAWEYLHRVQHRLTKPVCTPCACIGKVQRHTTQKPVEMWPQVEINQILGWTSFTKTYHENI